MSTAEFRNMVVIIIASNEGQTEWGSGIKLLRAFYTTHTMHKFHVSHKLMNRFTHKTWQIWSKKISYGHIYTLQTCSADPRLKIIQFCKFVSNKQFKAKCMENVGTLIYTCLLNGNMLTGCSSAANCETILPHTATCKGEWLWLCSTEPEHWCKNSLWIYVQ